MYSSYLSKEPIMRGQASAVKVTFNSTGEMGVQDKNSHINIQCENKSNDHPYERHC